jgi:O-antigen/teichoic acid export membrane protein
VGTVRTNVLANLAGQGWSALLQLLLVPLYIHFLGIEAYGVVSLYVVLITSIQIFDLGMAQTLNRELARAQGLASSEEDVRDLVRTVEVTYWVIIMIVCAALFVAAPGFSEHVLKPSQLDRATVRQAVSLIVLVVALQWPVTLYYSGLMGLQQQIAANSLRIALGTFTGAGAVLVLWLVSPTLPAFFAWQLVAAAVSAASSAWLFHARLPRAERRARFQPAMLARMWRFAAGMSALTISALALTQLDKWILVNLLSLEAFGYFALAWTAAGALNLMVAPIFAALYPRFSMLVARGEDQALQQLYHRATQALVCGIAPAALLLALYSEQVLRLWTRNPGVALHAAPLLSVLVLGSFLNGITHLPYASELAHGRTRVFLVFNLVAIVFALPAVWLSASHIGAMGAALVWLAVNAGYVLVVIPHIHRNLSRAERVRWLLQDVALPTAAALSILGLVRLIVPLPSEGAHVLLMLVSLLGIATSLAAWAAPATHSLLWNALRAIGVAPK